MISCGCSKRTGTCSRLSGPGHGLRCAGTIVPRAGERASLAWLRLRGLARLHSTNYSFRKALVRHAASCCAHFFDGICMLTVDRKSLASPHREMQIVQDVRRQQAAAKLLHSRDKYRCCAARSRSSFKSCSCDDTVESSQQEALEELSQSTP